MNENTTILTSVIASDKIDNFNQILSNDITIIPIKINISALLYFVKSFLITALIRPRPANAADVVINARIIVLIDTIDTRTDNVIPFKIAKMINNGNDIGFTVFVFRPIAITRSTSRPVKTSADNPKCEATNV